MLLEAATDGVTRCFTQLVERRRRYRDVARSRRREQRDRGHVGASNRQPVLQGYPRSGSDARWPGTNVGNDDRVLVGLAFAFLAVCLLNTVGLLLAKFLNNAPLTGVRRALGASRRQVFYQHLVEVGVISSIGAVLGLAVGALFLMSLRAMYSFDPANTAGTQALAHVDTTSLATALLLALFATLAAGLYPAWRIGRIPPATYLKAQ